VLLRPIQTPKAVIYGFYRDDHPPEMVVLEGWAEGWEGWEDEARVA
jgi:hypothetical protein